MKLCLYFVVVTLAVQQYFLIRAMAAADRHYLTDGKPMQANDSLDFNEAQAATSINLLPPIEAIVRVEVIRVLGKLLLPWAALLTSPAGRHMTTEMVGSRRNRARLDLQIR